MINRRSISFRLTTMNLLVSGLALVLACAGFLVYDQFTFRQSLVHTLSAQAQIIGSNSVSALLFNDPQSAAKTLEALRSSTNIASAGVLTGDKRAFASYTRTPSDEIVTIPALGAGKDEGYWFRNTHVVLVRAISSDERVIGYVYLRADLNELALRLQKYVIIAAILLGISLLVAVFVSRTFQKSITKPMTSLADMAMRVSRERNYSLRMPEQADSTEMAVLITSFNNMLREVQEGESALQSAHDELEKRVQERTRELLTANRELEAFSYSVSHDLRGPLDGMNGFSYVLLQQYGAALGSGGKEVVEHIRASARKMRELIDVLLNLSRVSTSTMNIEAVDLSAVARSIAEELRRSDPSRQVEFRIASLQPVRGDVRLLRIALDNLLRNAWKYTSRHAKATIEFGASQGEEELLYFVRDDGAGFDQSAASQLFQPFHRLHSPAEFQGDGIGLATVRRIVARHGGEIWAEAAPEKGATFWFTFAAEGNQDERAQAPN
jgi:signal transduction histidine kinase